MEALLSAILGKSLYFDGERYFLVPDDAPRPTRGHEAWTVAGEERRLSPEQIGAFEVDEAGAEAFIQDEIREVVGRLMPVLGAMLTSAGTQSDPREVSALMAGVEQTLASVARGDQGAIERFRERAARVSAAIAAQGRPEMAALVRELPDRLVELLGRS